MFFVPVEILYFARNLKNLLIILFETNLTLLQKKNAYKQRNKRRTLSAP